MSVIMRKEIFEQPEAVRKTLNQVSTLTNKLTLISEAEIKKVLFIARGTSDNVATYGLFLIPIAAGIETYSISPSLLNNYGFESRLDKTLVIAISQSGETQEIVTATEKAKALGAKVLAITNNENSSLEKVADVCIVTPAGKEVAVPATKTYSTAVTALAAAVAVIFQNTKLLQTLGAVPKIMEDQLNDLVIDSTIIELLGKSQTAVFAGRGISLGAVLEAALKLKETCAINAIGTSVSDFVHGPIAALSQSVPLVIFSADQKSPIYDGLIDLIGRAEATGSPIITVGCFNANERSALSIQVCNETDLELIAPLVLAIPSQLLAAEVSDYKGLNADAPTVLNKVTQTA